MLPNSSEIAKSCSSDFDYFCNEDKLVLDICGDLNFDALQNSNKNI